MSSNMAAAGTSKVSLLCSLFACIVLAIVKADDDHGANVVSYSARTFKDGLAEKRNFVMFYAPWCGHCKRLSPTWDELAKKYNSNPEESPVIVAKVDCSEEMALCASQDITGYPTLKLFEDGADPVRYRGSRELMALQDFIEERVAKNEQVEQPPPEEPAPALVSLDDATFTEHIKYGRHFVKFFAPWCTHCQQMASAWEQLAQSYAHTDVASIAEVDCTKQRTICDVQDIQGYPTLVWFQDGQKVEHYNGERSLDEMRQFVKRMVERPATIQTNDGAIPEFVVEPQDGVKVLTEDNFDEIVSSNTVFVKFFAPWCGHCKRLAPTWEDLARKFASREDVLIAEVDCTKHASVCQKHKLRGYPTLLMFRNGIQLGEYSGQRTLEGLQAFVNEYLGIHEEL